MLFIMTCKTTRTQREDEKGYNKAQEFGLEQVQFEMPIKFEVSK